MTDEPRNDTPSQPEDDHDAKTGDEHVADEIVHAVDEPSSIEEEMLTEAAELEEIEAGAASGIAHEASAEAAAEVHPMPEDPVLAELAAAFADVRFELVTPPAGPAQDVAHVPGETLVAFMTAARDAGYRTFIDLCGVDYLRRRPRFEVVINVVDQDRPHRLRVRVGAEATDPAVPSITSVYAGANFYEREAYDMFGIAFDGHPDLTRILMPDDWEGHPLRKDFAVGSVPVQFKGSHQAS